MLVRAVQFFTNESWRAQSQTNRVATFVGVPKIPVFKLLVAIVLTFFFVVPGLLYYVFAIRKVRRLQNLVVTTTPKEVGCEVVVTYPGYVQGYVDSFFAALPGSVPQQRIATTCVGCGNEIAQGIKFCTSCGSPALSPATPLPPA